MIAAAFDETEARDPGHLRTWIVLVDGAEAVFTLRAVTSNGDFGEYWSLPPRP